MTEISFHPVYAVQPWSIGLGAVKGNFNEAYNNDTVTYQGNLLVVVEVGVV